VTDHRDWVHGISFAPDGKTFVTVAGHVGENLHVYDTKQIQGLPTWDPNAENQLHTMGTHKKMDTKHNGGVMDVAHSPSGEALVTVSIDHCIHVIDLSKGIKDMDILKRIPTNHTGTVYGISFHPSGRVFSTVSAGKTLRIWDASSFELVSALSLKHSEGMRGIACRSSPGERGADWLTVSEDGSVCCVGSGVDATLFRTLEMDCPEKIISACSVCFSASSTEILTAQTNGMVQRRRLSDFKLLSEHKVVLSDEFVLKSKRFMLIGVAYLQDDCRAFIAVSENHNQHAQVWTHSGPHRDDWSKENFGLGHKEDNANVVGVSACVIGDGKCRVVTIANASLRTPDSTTAKFGVARVFEFDRDSDSGLTPLPLGSCDSSLRIELNFESKVVGLSHCQAGAHQGWWCVASEDGDIRVWDKANVCRFWFPHYPIISSKIRSVVFTSHVEGTFCFVCLGFDLQMTSLLCQLPPPVAEATPIIHSTVDSGFSTFASGLAVAPSGRSLICIGASTVQQGAGKPQCRVFDTAASCWRWGGIQPEAAALNMPTMLLHHCLQPASVANNKNIRQYLQYVTRQDADMYHMSRWIDHSFIDLPLKLTMGMESGSDGMLKNLEGAQCILESILQHKSRSPAVQRQYQQHDTGNVARMLQRQRACADVLTVEVLQALVQLQPKLAVHIFTKKLELDRVYPSQLNHKMPRTLDLNEDKNASFLVAVSSDWDPGVAWEKESELKPDGFVALFHHMAQRLVWFLEGPSNRVKKMLWCPESKFMCDVEPFVCGIKGLLDPTSFGGGKQGVTKGVELLHTICRNPALFDIFETEVVHVLIKYHWSSPQYRSSPLHHWVCFEALLHVVNMGCYIGWAFSVPGTRQAWVAESEEYQTFHHSPDDCGSDESCRQLASGFAGFVAVYTVLLFAYEFMVDWAETRMIVTENTHLHIHEHHSNKWQRHHSNNAHRHLVRANSKHDLKIHSTVKAVCKSWLRFVGYFWQSLSLWDVCLYWSILLTAYSLLDWVVSGTVGSWAISLNFILMTARILSFMRAVDQLAPLVHMIVAGAIYSSHSLLQHTLTECNSLRPWWIVAVFEDMKWLLAVLFIILLGLSVCFYFELSVFYDSSKTFESYRHSTLSTFQMWMGEQDPTSNGIVLRTWTSAGLFFMMSVIGPVVLLNLVIAKISDTYASMLCSPRVVLCSPWVFPFLCRYTKTMKKIDVLRWQAKAQMVVAAAAFVDARWWLWHRRQENGDLFVASCLWSEWLGKCIEGCCSKHATEAASADSQDNQWLHVLKPVDTRAVYGTIHMGAGAVEEAKVDSLQRTVQQLALVLLSQHPHLTSRISRLVPLTAPHRRPLPAACRRARWMGAL
jgi:WD40 repeat protein